MYQCLPKRVKKENFEMPVKAIGGFLAIIFASQIQTAGAQSGAANIQSRLEFASSDSQLVEGFERAKTQAMAYAFEDDPVGPWYEAAEPGREAFCMRDVSHQCMGAQALGLARQNLNMLRRFAANISDSKDWCSFWEIDRYNRPAPVDYDNDAQFWYNLPANFDVLDASYRMFLWSGDLAYVNDPVFRNFYDRTVTDYVERWGLGINEVMKRPRLLNIRGMFDAGKKFQIARGIPGYDEGTKGYVLGADVLATQYDAYVAYGQIQEVLGKGELARTFLNKAAEVRALVNKTWWDEAEHHYYAQLSKDHQLEGRAGGELLYRDIVDAGPKVKSALADGGERNLEALFKYGDPDKANARLLEVMTPGKSRMDYPEIPFSIISNVVNGTMGVNLEAPPALLSGVEGYWVATAVKTLSGLGTRIQWAELKNLPIRANEVTVRQDGNSETRITNQRGPAFIWLAQFRGSYQTLLVNGKPMKARNENAPSGEPVSTVRVAVGGGDTVTVAVPNASSKR
jgi:hypothetical protein